MEKETHAILDDSDLEYYRQRLDKITYEETKPQKVSFCSHLTVAKGKLVRVEICSLGCRYTKCGLLLDVGEDFVSIRVGNAAVSTAIPINNILSITLIHGNGKIMK